MMPILDSLLSCCMLDDMTTLRGESRPEVTWMYAYPPMRNNAMIPTATAMTFVPLFTGLTLFGCIKILK